MQRDDTLWKAILEDIFDDFLRYFIPDADTYFAMERGFEFLDKELEQLFPPENDEFQPRYVDKLVKVYTRQGDEQWVLIHIEVQGYPDPNFAYRILDKYQRPIAAFAILTDASPKFRPDAYEHTFLGTNLHYGFNAYKIADQSDELLNQSNNPFAMVVQTVKVALLGKKKSINGEKLLSLKIDLAKRLLNRQIPKNKIRVLMDFLRYYVRFEDAELYTKFEEQVGLLTNRTTTMGLEEFLLQRAEKQGEEKGEKIGEQKGIVLAQRAFVQNLLDKTDYSDEVIADLVGVTVASVSSLRK